MATRRSHTKSRLGCHQCKKRRIKCDTKQPSCANCDKRSLECSFLLLAPTSRLSVVSTSPTSIGPSTPETTSPSSISSLSPIAISPNPQRSPQLQTQLAVIRKRETSPRPPTADLYAELALPKVPIPRFLPFNDAWRNIRNPLAPHLQEVLDHYEYTTSLTLANDDPAKAAWQSFVPELATRHDFVVNCVLAVASLHLGRLHEDVDKKNTMTAVAAAQMNKALAQFRIELANITQDNAAALFASSTLTAVYFFRTSSVDFEALRASIPPGTIVPPPELIDKMIHLVLRSVWALRGPLSVLLSGWNWVVSGKMSSVAERQWWPKDRILATPRAVEEDARLCAIESLWTQPDQVVQLHHQTLSEALAYLRDSYALVSQLTLPKKYRPVTAIPYSVDDTTVGTLRDRGAIFVWAAQISRDFIQLVESKNREALVILAHWGVLPGRVRGVWWMEGLGANLVTAVAMALGPAHSHLIEFPASSVGIDLKNPLGPRKDRLEGKPDELNMDVI